MANLVYQRINSIKSLARVTALINSISYGKYNVIHYVIEQMIVGGKANNEYVKKIIN